MLDFTSPFGKRMLHRLRDEQIIWLTTIGADATPQPRPVWFHWDGETALIFSQVDAAKVHHIRRNPHVAVNFNTDTEGDDVGVFIGQASLLDKPVDPQRLEAYIRKYEEGIRGLGMTPEQMLAEYSLAILFAPTSMRGF